MPEHKRTIEIFAYTSNDGRPVCCLDFSAGKTCKFLRVSGLKGTPFCAMYEKYPGTYDNDTLEYIMPVDGCELHAS